MQLAYENQKAYCPAEIGTAISRSAAEAMMRIRLPFVPTPAARAALNVLISHRSTEFDRAKAFASRLSRLGFTVKLLEPGLLPPQSDKELTQLLGDIVLSTDVCCTMVSLRRSLGMGPIRISRSRCNLWPRHLPIR